MEEDDDDDDDDDDKLEDKRFHTELEQAFPEFSLFLISPRMQFGFDMGSSQILHPSKYFKFFVGPDLFQSYGTVT